MIHGDAARSTGITEAASYAALIAGFTTACIVLCGLSARQQRRRLVKLEEEVKRQVALRNGEHAGRVKAEKELRAFFTGTMKADGGVLYAPIGTVHSCFKECVGTPRQGQFAPSTRALVVFEKGSVSPVALEGVEEFSHIWIFWGFHLNTNAKDARAHAGVRADSRGHTFPAKVSPPFLKRRVGIFSTRTPHRPNPIGMSLCKVEEVNAAERSIRLSGVDLVEGTPVLDIKPYVPDYDRPLERVSSGSDSGCGDAGVRVAKWVEASVQRRRTVEWDPDAEGQLHEVCEEAFQRGKGTGMRFFRGDAVAAKGAITETLAVDVRSIRKTREALGAPSCVLLFDGLRVEYDTSPTPSATPATINAYTAGSGSTAISPPKTESLMSISPRGTPLLTPTSGAASSGGCVPSAGVNDSTSPGDDGNFDDGIQKPDCPVIPPSVLESVRVLSVSILR